MFGIKRKIERHYQNYFLLNKPNNKKISFIENLLILYFSHKELKKEANFFSMQSPVPRKANRYASLSMKLLSGFMPNNLGNWTIKTPYYLTNRLEKSSIEIIKKYYNAPKEILGHFSSGSTEGNIYATWIGRNFLINKLNLTDTEKIILFKNSLSHYSLSKSANLCNIKTHELAINSSIWSIDEKDLSESLEKLYLNGYRGFLIPLTLGYTVTGTEDDLILLNKVIQKFLVSHKDCKSFVWLDAAFSGVSKIFLEPNFKPFSYPQIQLITSDFHKLLAVPYPSSFILYKPNLIKYIKQEIAYIDQVDSTLLGSRPGLNVFATWFSLINLNIKNTKQIFENCLIEKEKFLKKINELDEKIEVINNPKSLQACFIIPASSKKVIKNIKKKYFLDPLEYKIKFIENTRNTTIYKLYFLPKI